MDSIKRRYGWLPDLPDQRDFLFSLLKVPARLPKSVDLRPQCSPIENQGSLGSCTANALAGAVEFLELKDGVKFKDASRLFIYYNERLLIGTVNEDSGAYIRDGIKTLVKQGVCAETSWPYDISKFTKEPLQKCYEEALDHQIISYYRIGTLNQMKACLASGFPFVFGFSVYESFESEKVAKTGEVKMPKIWERCLGGHAVMAIGYNDNLKRFIVRNSWGEDWGMKGYFTIPYSYLSSRSLSDDFWTIRKQEGGENQ